MRIKISNITLTPGVTNEKHIPFVQDAEIQIVDQRIVYAGSREEAPAFEADQFIGGAGALAMPGLCNLHTHTAMTLMRSTGNDLALGNWLRDAVWPVEKNLTDESVRAGSDLGIMEMLRFGTTSFNDMYMHMDQLAMAVEDSGIRAMLGYGIADFDESCKDLLPGIELVEKWQGKNDRIKLNFGPHSEGCTTPALLKRVRQEAKKYGIPIHIHISEAAEDVVNCVKNRGLRPPEYYDSLGLLDYPVIAAHCVWLNDGEIDLFAKKGVFIVHNPISNLKLASGIAPIGKMLAAGCKVTLGTDGVASNNNLNLWEEMKLMPLLQKGTMLDATVVSPAQVLAAATSVGAEALGYTDLGLLKKGYLADLILVDIHQPHVYPCNDLETELIYSTQGSDVVMTMVNGKVLYDHGTFTTMNPASVLKKAQEQRDMLYQNVKAGGGKWDA